MKRHVFDQAFKQMAVELSYAKGSVKIAAQELGIDPGSLSKWQQSEQDSNVVPVEKPILTAEQLEIKRLQKELKEAQWERDIRTRCPHRLLVQKRRWASFPGARGHIQVYKKPQGDISYRKDV
ncbi:transposase [Rhodocytophaga rosea]|uniref:Transposase n=1 Tax=Rhodocytophaga rosea TaxID=2704465 RepID=A0A6C0GH07_9BACT|nr:transposase [Rhodocytophaga rosea]QHT66980.1 transposase [Rhodocytophaga rosea]